MSRVVTIPCEILMPKNLQQSETNIVINNKSQTSVAMQCKMYEY